MGSIALTLLEEAAPPPPPQMGGIALTLLEEAAPPPPPPPKWVVLPLHSWKRQYHPPPLPQSVGQTESEKESGEKHDLVENTTSMQRSYISGKFDTYLLDLTTAHS